MNRRHVLALVAGAVAWPCAGGAQPARIPKIGYVGAGSVANAGHHARAFEGGLRDLGWPEEQSDRLFTAHDGRACGHRGRRAREVVRLAAVVPDCQPGERRRRGRAAVGGNGRGRRVDRGPIVACADRQGPGPAEVATRHGGLRAVIGQHPGRETGAGRCSRAGPIRQFRPDVRVLG